MERSFRRGVNLPAERVAKLKRSIYSNPCKGDRYDYRTELNEPFVHMRNAGSRPFAQKKVDAISYR